MGGGGEERHDTKKLKKNVLRTKQTNKIKPGKNLKQNEAQSARAESTHKGVN